MHPHEGQRHVVGRVKLRGLANERWLAEASHHAHAKVLEAESGRIEGREDCQTRVCDLCNELRTLEKAGQLLSNHTNASDECLSLRLTPLRGLLSNHIRVEGLLLRCQLFSMGLLLVKLLLLHRCLQLVLVLERLSLHLLLARDTFLVGLSTLLPHCLLLLQLLTVALELELYLVLSLLLFHLLLILDRLTLLLFLYLSLLDL